MTWFFLALVSAVLWGASYVLYGQLVKTVSSAAVLFYSALGATAVYGLWAAARGALAADGQIFRKGGVELWYLGLLIFINAAANLLMLASMKMKNATLSAMVEMSFPLFTALFAWVFFREVQAGPGAWLGMALVMAGLACIYYFEKAS